MERDHWFTGFTQARGGTRSCHWCLPPLVLRTDPEQEASIRRSCAASAGKFAVVVVAVVAVGIVVIVAIVVIIVTVTVIVTRDICAPVLSLHMTPTTPRFLHLCLPNINTLTSGANVHHKR